jgi:hypothetical protein
MINALINKPVAIHYSAIESFAAFSRGVVIEVSDRWLKLELPKKKNRVRYEYISLDRILKIVADE